MGNNSVEGILETHKALSYFCDTYYGDTVLVAPVLKVDEEKNSTTAVAFYPKKKEEEIDGSSYMFVMPVDKEDMDQIMDRLKDHIGDMNGHTTTGGGTLH